jgi:choline dehydrogenase
MSGMDEEREKPREWTRREFLSASLKTGLGAAALATTASSSRIVRALTTPEADEFEYIVIGSGAGGGPLACNLARAGKHVLLIEAGGLDWNTNIETPAFHPKASEDPSVAWNYFVEHYSDPARQARDSKRVPGKGILYPRAGTVGGCTVTNAMVTLYPDHRDWEYIARLTGDSSWDAQTMRGYFDKMENARYLDPIRAITTGRGRSGWLSTEQTDPGFLFRDERLRSIGLSVIGREGLGEELFKKFFLEGGNVQLDPNDPNYVRNKTNGIFNIPKATFKGKRSGVRNLILETMRTYPQNLQLQPHTLVTKLIFDPNDPKRVMGVDCLEGARIYRADPRASDTSQAKRRSFVARKEVILCGGAFNSPQILLLSGIGSAGDLQSLGIPLRHKLPGVGRNLQDRYEVCVVSQLDGPISLIEKCRFGQGNDACFADYQNNSETSPYASNGIVVAVLRESENHVGGPDLCLFGLPGGFRGYYPGYSKDSLVSDRFSWALLKGHTRNNAGYVKLKSADPLDTPDINFKYFDEGNDERQEDLAAVVEGLKRIREINGMGPSKSMIQAELTPGKGDTDEELAEFVKSEAWGHHASCSNKMGPASDPLAVVDSRFRVHGLQGLRIVDASVFPKIPGLFIAAPIYMIAEKASEDILRGA